MLAEGPHGISNDPLQIKKSNPCQSHFLKFNFSFGPLCTEHFTNFYSLNTHISRFHHFFISLRTLVTIQSTTPGGPAQAAHDGRIYFAGVPGPPPPRSEATARSGRTWRAGGWQLQGGLGMEDVPMKGKMCS